MYFVKICIQTNVPRVLIWILFITDVPAASSDSHNIAEGVPFASGATAAVWKHDVRGSSSAFLSRVTNKFTAWK